MNKLPTMLSEENVRNIYESLPKERLIQILVNRWENKRKEISKSLPDFS